MRFSTNAAYAAYLDAACALNGAPKAVATGKTDQDGKAIFKIDLPEEKQQELMDDVECEIQSAKMGGIPVRSYATLMNPEKKARGVALSGTSAFIPYDKDRRRIEREFLGI